MLVVKDRRGSNPLLPFSIILALSNNEK